jgi:mono/diheme cytochrome c family protein
MVQTMYRAWLTLIAALPLAAGSFDKTVEPFLQANCFLCHSEKTHTADLNLQVFRSPADVLQKRELWERVEIKLKTGEMPPKGLPRPDPRQLQAVTDWIENEFARADRKLKPDPGHVTAHRLNRFEYNNTIHDLLAVDFQPADDFPADDSGYGFDNIGDVLSLSPLLMEKYLAAAEKIARAAIAADPLPKPSLVKLKRAADSKAPSFSAVYTFAVEGDYEIRTQIGGRRDPAKAVLSLDGKPQESFELDLDPRIPRLADFKLHIARGEHKLSVQLAAGDSPPIKVDLKDPTPSVNSIELRGPYRPVAPPPPESHKRIFVCGHASGQHTASCARQDLREIARRAWRRPVSDTEVEGLARFVAMAQQNGDSFEQGMRVALEVVLVSPHFLFRIERDPEPVNPGKTYRVGEFELASRLSYFLWSSLPDDELFRLAERKELHKSAILAAQVKRMLANAKSKRLVRNFAGQWLELRNLESAKPDPDKFPGFDNELREAMRTETELFFEAVIKEDRSILDFIDAKFTFINGRLARHYGIPGVSGNEFRRVALTDDRRSGVLTQASVLTVSSYATRTSPVIRGKFLLENILNAPPPPPPANVPNLDEAAVGKTASLREQLEKHRTGSCASCHARMDPLGFGLENFDAIGRWREFDGKFRVDAAGTLPNGKNFNGPVELKQILKGDSAAFADCLTEKLLTYALGRGLERYDKPAVQLISRHTAQADYRFSRLVLEIVDSLPFQMRRGAVVKGGP